MKNQIKKWISAIIAKCIHKYKFLSKVPRNIKLITSYKTDSNVNQSKCCNSSQIMFQLRL